MLSFVILILSVLVIDGTAQDCSPLHFIWSRGTFEAPQNVDHRNEAAWDAQAAKDTGKGYGMWGWILYKNLTSLIPGTTSRPTHYPADFSGCNSERAGVEDIVQQVTKLAEACPNQRYVLGGHSQGGLITINAVKQLPKELLPKILAVTMIGSSLCPAEVKDRCRSYCMKGDQICTGDGGDRAKGRCEVPKQLIAQNMASTSSQTYTNLFSRQESLKLLDAPQCSAAEPPEKGMEGGVAFLGFNPFSYGKYIDVAACYIYNKYKESQKI